MKIGLLRKSAFFASLIVIWALVSKLNMWPPYLVPSPGGVAKALIDGFADGSFLLAIRTSLLRLAVGYSISIVLGISLGILLGHIKWLDETLGSLVLGLQTLPSVCWLPLAILWFGLNDKAIIFVVIMGALLSISISTRFGVNNVSPIYLKTAKTLGAQGIKVYTQVVLPAILPNVINGMKLGWSFAWRSLMAAELIYLGAGLGNLLQTGRELNDMSLVLAVMFVIVAIGLLVDKIVFVYFEKRIEEKWGMKSA